MRFAGAVGPLAALPQNLQALLYMFIATVCFASMHTAVRHVGSEIHPFEVAFFRNFVALLVALPWFLKIGTATLKTRRLGLHLLRAILQTVAMLMFFVALSLSPLVILSAISFAAPLFASLVAVVMLGERIRMRRGLALVVGFAGVLVVLRPGFSDLNPGVLLALASSSLWAFAIIFIKILTRTESNATIIAYMTLFMTVLTLIPAVFVWQWPSAGQLAWLTAIGMAGAVGQLLVTQSLRIGEATLVMPLDFMRLIWVSLFGYAFFAEIPDFWGWIGGVIIFASGTYISFREVKLKGRPPKGESVTTLPG